MAVPDTALLALLGSRDESLRTAEELLDADVHVRGNEVTLSGTPRTSPSPSGSSAS
jgi:phosphate starvation-inducible PhoH-like protein